MQLGGMSPQQLVQLVPAEEEDSAGEGGGLIGGGGEGGWQSRLQTVALVAPRSMQDWYSPVHIHIVWPLLLQQRGLVLTGLLLQSITLLGSQQSVQPQSGAHASPPPKEHEVVGLRHSQEAGPPTAMLQHLATWRPPQVGCRPLQQLVQDAPEGGGGEPGVRGPESPMKKYWPPIATANTMTARQRPSNPVSIFDDTRIDEDSTMRLFAVQEILIAPLGLSTSKIFLSRTASSG